MRRGSGVGGGSIAAALAERHGGVTPRGDLKAPVTGVAAPELPSSPEMVG